MSKPGKRSKTAFRKPTSHPIPPAPKSLLFWNNAKDTTLTAINSERSSANRLTLWTPFTTEDGITDVTMTLHKPGARGTQHTRSGEDPSIHSADFGAITLELTAAERKAMKAEHNKQRQERQQELARRQYRRDRRAQRETLATS